MDRQLAAIILASALAAAIILGFVLGERTSGKEEVKTIYSTVYRYETVYKTITLTGTAETRPSTTYNFSEEWSTIVALAEAYRTMAPTVYKTIVTGAPSLVVTQAAEWKPAPITTLPTAAVGGAEVYYSGTNVQVAGVDEQDIVKTNGTHIVVAKGQILEVYRAYPPDKLALIGKVNVTSIVEKLAGKEYLALIRGNTTTILGEVQRAASISGVYYVNKTIILIVNEYRWPGPLETRSWIIELNPSLEPQRYLVSTGHVYDSRLVNGTIVLVTSSGVVKPVIVLGRAGTTKIAVVPPPFIAGLPTVETIVTALSLREWKADSLAEVGAPPEALYVAANGDIYLALRGLMEVKKIISQAKQNLTLAVKELRRIPLIVEKLNTTIVRIELSSGPKLVVAGNATVPGRVWKQWMMDLYQLLKK
jgi:uncharacterized secreted protein with C-terminal beta-propeller domain